MGRNFKASKNVIINCLICNKEIKTTKNKVNKGTKYCSRECKNKSMQNRIERNCDNCNKILSLERKKSLQKYCFCNMNCRNEFIKKNRSYNCTRVEYRCDFCKKEIEIKNHVYKELLTGKRKNVFCSRTCQGKWYSENKVRENNPNYSQIIKICNYCNKEYSVPQGRKNKSKFCSSECRQKCSRNRIKLNCTNCEKEIEKTPSQFKKSKNHFCSNRCADSFNSEKRKIVKECEICRKEFKVKKSLAKQRFCSIECQSIWQSKELRGINANGYKSEFSLKDRTVNCKWCNSEFTIMPHKIKEKEHLNLFCSKKCKQEWFIQEWSQQDEWKNECKIRAVKLLEDRIINSDTWCQREVNKILKEMGIEFENEYNCKYVSIDNYIKKHHLMIEVMGTYWHADPRIYKEINYQMQVDRIKNDKIKHTYIKNNYGIEILYLWENDIKNDKELCKKLIKIYIENNGILENYHSLNYRKIDNTIMLNNNLIKPYMDYNIEDLNKIIDIKTKKRSMKQQEKWIKFDCEFCGEQTEQLISRYKKSNNHYCSSNCARKGRKGKKIKRRKIS